jgi:hypothetical protein
MTLCERALQPLWGASMADSFSVFQAAARSGARANTILALQPLTPSLFEAALVDLKTRTAAKSSVGGAAEAYSGSVLSQSLLLSFRTNPKVLVDPLTASVAASGVGGSVAATAPPAPVSASPSFIPLRSKAAAPARVPLLNLSRILSETPSVHSLSTVLASPLNTRSEWLRRGGGIAPSIKPIVGDKTAVFPGRPAGKGADVESEAMAELAEVLREKQQRLQQPLADTVAVQYRSLKCPSPDLGYRIVFNGSSNFNRFNPFDSVRVVSARSSRTILDRAVAPLSQRQMPPRRANHGQYITFREDFFDGDQCRAATRSSSSGRSCLGARTAKSAASLKLQSKLDALESSTLKALQVQPVARAPDTSRAAVAPRIAFTNPSPASAAQPSPVPPKAAAAPAHASPGPLARRAGLTKPDSDMTILQNVFAGASERKLN